MRRGRTPQPEDREAPSTARPGRGRPERWPLSQFLPMAPAVLLALCFLGASWSPG